MNDRNFVNFHILLSHSPSNLNRDDMGMQKTAVFGGVKRVRISSQCLKRAIRTSDYYNKHFKEVSIRTKELKKLLEKMKEKLKDEIEDRWIQKAIEMLSGHPIESSNESDNSKGKSNSNESKNVAVAPWSIEEFKYVCETIKQIYEQPLTEEEEKKLNKNKKKKPPEEIKDDFLKKKVEEQLKGKKEELKKALGKTMDIALSGRMTTSGIMESVDGSLAVAHAISTHAVDSEIDWFTAVDDLKQEEDSEDKGSAHLGTTEFSSAVFYRYASLNLKQLQKNLGEEENDRIKALEIVSHVLHLLATVSPSAKQNAFAAHNMADFALVTFSKQPLSLANAFETPVQDRDKEGLLPPSVHALLKYQKSIEEVYGLKEDPKGFYSVRHCYSNSKHNDKQTAHTKGLEDLKTLEKIKSWVKNNDCS